MASHGAPCVLSPVYHLGSWLGEVFEARTKGTATRLRRNASKGASVRLVKAHKHHQVKVVQWFPNPPAMGLSENRVIMGINSQERDGEIIVPASQNLRIDL